MAICPSFCFATTGYADTRFLATFLDTGSAIGPLSNPQHLIFDDARINPGGYYSETSGKYTVRVKPLYAMMT